jgi:hypothetical protein
MWVMASDTIVSSVRRFSRESDRGEDGVTRLQREYLARDGMKSYQYLVSSPTNDGVGCAGDTDLVLLPTCRPEHAVYERTSNNLDDGPGYPLHCLTTWDRLYCYA